MPDYYTILDIDVEAGFTAIDDAYRRLGRLHQGDEATQRRLREAWSVLSNPLTRKEYDRSLGAAADDRRPIEKGAPPLPSSNIPSKRPTTEVIEIATPPAARPGRRPTTEVIDIHSPAPTNRPARPATEIIDVQPSVPQARSRPITEILSTDGARPPQARPVTEILDASSSAPPLAASSPLVAAPPGPIRIVVTDPDGNNRNHILDDGVHIIGRPSKSGINPAVQLNDRFVSRDHARIVKEIGSVVVIDKNSVNGTKLNGCRLDAGQPYPLHDHDKIEIEGFILWVDFSMDDRVP